MGGTQAQAAHQGCGAGFWHHMPSFRALSAPLLPSLPARRRSNMETATRFRLCRWCVWRGLCVCVCGFVRRRRRLRRRRRQAFECDASVAVVKAKRLKRHHACFFMQPRSGVRATVHNTLSMGRHGGSAQHLPRNTPKESLLAKARGSKVVQRANAPIAKARGAPMAAVC